MDDISTLPKSPANNLALMKGILPGCVISIKSDIERKKEIDLTAGTSLGVQYAIPLFISTGDMAHMSATSIDTRKAQIGI
jgi:hypothetical protein